MPEIPVAVPPHRTVGAARVPCLAKGPPMGDDREMPRLPFFRRGPSFEGSPNRFVVLAAGETPPPGDAGDVRVDGEGRMSPAHREDHIRGLRANAGKGHELVPRPVRRKGEDLIEAAGPPVADLLGDGADPGGLLAGEAGMPNRPGDVLLRNAGEAVGRNLADRALAKHDRDERAPREHGRYQNL